MHFSTKIISLLFILSVSFHCYSQEIKKGEVYKYGRKIVDTMASAAMHGRGYVMGGDSIAAVYLKNEFQKLGLEKLGKDYYQKFYFNINTFPGQMQVIIDGKELIPGKDYIINPNFKATNTTTKIVYFKFSAFNTKSKTLNRLSKKFRNNFVINDSSATKGDGRYLACELTATGVINKEKKLTMHMSQKESNCAEIILLSDVNIEKAKEIKINIENKMIYDYPTQNVIGYVKGSIYPDSFIVFSAHYDHLGHMGKNVYFPGANDNASGCAMLLNLAKHYAKPENKPKYSVVFMAFAGEEVAILGSQYYTEHPLVPLKNTKFVFNMDLMGTGEDGVTIVNGSVFKTEFEKLKQINAENNYLKEIKMRGKAANSDHYYFSEKGVKAFFIYTMGGITAYHDIYDRPETLPLTEFEDLFQLIVKFGDYLQN